MANVPFAFIARRGLVRTVVPMGSQVQRLRYLPTRVLCDVRYCRSVWCYLPKRVRVLCDARY
eukprot:3072575-Rhodomonas_salina.1